MMEMQQIRQAVARGWCQENTEHLDLNSELAEAIAQEIHKIDTEPNLVYATTIELIEELLARTHVARITGETWPDYKTIDPL